MQFDWSRTAHDKIYTDQYQKQPSAVFCKKGVLRYFVKFTGKHL